MPAHVCAGDQVAPLPVLVAHLKQTLGSGCSWRLKKDIVRLRAITHALWVTTAPGYSSGRSGTATEATAALAELDGVLEKFDPEWHRCLEFNRSATVRLLGTKFAGLEES